jgi:Protein of unknown function (DUF4230)
MFEIFFFIIAVTIGGFLAWYGFTWFYRKKLNPNAGLVSNAEATVLLERIEKVFKVVLAEGYFSEIYDHNTKKDFFGLFEMKNKALVVAKAKVAVGFDFSKMKFEKDEKTRKLRVVEFAPAEILSIDTDYKFYDINQGLLSKFNNEDYTSILSEAKKMMHQKAMESDLPQIAANQVKVMMKELANTMNWELEASNLQELPIEPKLLSK